MPVSRGLGIAVPYGVSYYRITSLAFRTTSSKHPTDGPAQLPCRRGPGDRPGSAGRTSRPASRVLRLDPRAI